MSRKEIDAYLWVEERLFKWMIKNGVDVTLAKARTEVATARAFHVEPANWAKRDIGAFVENARAFERKRDEVERRLVEARARTHEAEVDLMKRQGNNFNPLKIAAMYWFKEERMKEPNDPYCIAVEQEFKIAHEREQIYHQFNKETPEERLGGGLAILLVGGMLGGEGEAGLTGEAEAALGSLGEAEAALALTESDVALTSIMKARAILIPAQEEAALAAVEEARTAIAADNVEGAAAAVQEAQAALKARLQVDPAAALALAAVNEVQAKIEAAHDAEAKLVAAEKADADLAVKEKTKINLYYYSSTHQDDVIKFLSGDLKEALDFASQYRASLAKVETKHPQNTLRGAAAAWTDPATGLMWAKKDNGYDVSWQQATDYCRNLQLADHSDWRLATSDELSTICNLNEDVNGFHAKGNLHLSSWWQWSSTPRNAAGDTWIFNFFVKSRDYLVSGSTNELRVLCVRPS